MPFRFEIRDHIGWMIIDNPPFNSLTHPVFTDRDQLTDFLNDSRLKGIVVRGYGRHFCSGADPDSFTELFNSDNLEILLHQAKDLLQIISLATIPTVAVITGSCLGAGLEIALACHFRFAAKSAMLGFPETGHSLLPGLGGSVTGGKIMHKNHLIDLILTGRMIRAEEGHSIGIIDTIGPAKHIEEMALQYLDLLTSSHSTGLIRSVMQSINNSNSMSEQDALAMESKLFCKLAKELSTRKRQ